ncbi:MAG: GatB/YqeY domain-containing protein [Polyangiales bacterium]
MLIEEIRKRRTEAFKSRDNVTKEVLNVALGEIDTIAARHGRDATDEDCLGVLRKLVKSNEETRAAATDEAQRATLTAEIAVLNTLLPKSLDAEGVVAALAPVAAAVKAAPNDGAATGVAMKHLKTTGATVDGKVVSAAVRAMRA